MRTTLRALALAALVTTAGTAVRPAPVAAGDDHLLCVATCIAAAGVCGLATKASVEGCAIFLDGCFAGCELV